MNALCAPRQARCLQAQNQAGRRERAADVCAKLAETAECREELARVALPALGNLVQDTGTPAASMAAASTIALLAASPALLPRIKQNLSRHVMPGLVRNLKVRAVDPSRSSVRFVMTCLHCLGIASERLYMCSWAAGDCSHVRSPRVWVHLRRDPQWCQQRRCACESSHWLEVILCQPGPLYVNCWDNGSVRQGSHDPCHVLLTT